MLAKPVAQHLGGRVQGQPGLPEALPQEKADLCSWVLVPAEMVFGLLELAFQVAL